MQHSVANYVNNNDYDYDKQLRSQNKDITQLEAQINALRGVTNQAAVAKRARLEAELANKRQEREDTVREHGYDIQQQGYDKLSSDMQKALKNAIDLINGNQIALQLNTNEMLAQLKLNKVDEQNIINGIIQDSGTRIHDASRLALTESLMDPNGIVDYATRIYNHAVTSNTDLKTQLANQNASIANLISGIGDAGINGWIAGFKLQAHEDSVGIVNSINPKIEGITTGENSVNQKMQDIYNSLKDDYDVKFTDLQTKAGNIDTNVGSTKTNTNTISTNVASIMSKVDTLVKSTDLSSITRHLGKESNDFILKDTNTAIKDAGVTVGKAVNTLSTAINAEITARKAAEQAAKKAAEEKTKAAAAKKTTSTSTTPKQGIDSGAANRSNPAPASTSNNAQQISEYEQTLNNYRAQLAKLNTDTDYAKTKIRKWTQKVSETKNSAKKKEYQKKVNYYQSQFNILAQQASQISRLYNQTEAALKALRGYASGTKRVGYNGFAWTNEDYDTKGSELIVRPSDGAILTPLKANDAVIPPNLVENLFKWGAMNPDSFATNPFMGKWGETTGSKSSEVFSNNTANQNINLSFDSLFHIDGNVDSNVVDRLEDLGKSLTKNKEFQQNVINFVTRNYVKESRKQGFR